VAAMKRLLDRAQRNHNDPELFAGLVHACRYCGMLEACFAAHHKNVVGAQSGREPR
jgi:hypothetical protein